MQTPRREMQATGEEDSLTVRRPYRRELIVRQPDTANLFRAKTTAKRRKKAEVDQSTHDHPTDEDSYLQTNDALATQSATPMTNLFGPLQMTHGVTLSSSLMPASTNSLHERLTTLPNGPDYSCYRCSNLLYISQNNFSVCASCNLIYCFDCIRNTCFSTYGFTCESCHLNNALTFTQL